MFAPFGDGLVIASFPQVPLRSTWGYSSEPPSGANQVRTMTRAVFVAGGGASGMIAAIAAARRGARVRIVERMQRAGKKLLATGNGRCNLTNLHNRVAHYHGERPEFVLGAFEQFGVDETLHFFEELGIAWRAEPDGKVYPRSNQASSVLDVLRYELERLGVELLADTRVQSVVRKRDGLWCPCTDGNGLGPADAVIVAAGGMAAPNLGSNGGGFKIARVLGHRIVEPVPALVQVRLDAPWRKRLGGLKVDAAVTIALDGEPQRTETGEVLFAEYGLSGPPVLQVSRIAARHADGPRRVTIHLDLFPGTECDALEAEIAARAKQAPHKSIEFGFVGLLHKRLIPVLLAEAGIEDLRRDSASLGPEEIRRIAQTLKDWSAPCMGVRSWMHAQVTAGGVAVDEVDERTLESKLLPGVHFAGEVLDIDGDCGGYNLQWAWTSGYVAGCHAAGGSGA